jgi:hypothetical protein
VSPQWLLDLWERGRGLHPIDQGLLAASAAFPDDSESVADWPMGRRNRALAQLHAAVFGPVLHGWTACRDCQEQLEFRLDGRALAEGAAAAPDDRIAIGTRRYRLPTSRDLAAVAEEADADAAVSRLLARCLVGSDEPADEANVDAIGDQMAAADPLAEIQLRFECPNCGGAYDEPLDLAAFLWAELEASARSTLADVHRLARAYGWSEAEILALSPARRAAYLELVAG